MGVEMPQDRKTKKMMEEKKNEEKGEAVEGEDMGMGRPSAYSSWVIPYMSHTEL